MPEHEGPVRRSPISLIEFSLIVVCFAVMGALVYPVLAQHQGDGKSVCVTNEQILSVSIVMYAADHDEVLPPILNADSMPWPDTIDSYTQGKSVWVCPQEPSGGVINSYGVNGLIFVDRATDSHPLASPKISAIRTPDRTIMLGDVGTENDLVKPRINALAMAAPDASSLNAIDARPSSRHDGAANVVYFDSHASPVRLDQFYVGMTPPDRCFCADPNDLEACGTGKESSKDRL